MKKQPKRATKNRRRTESGPKAAHTLETYRASGSSPPATPVASAWAVPGAALVGFLGLLFAFVSTPDPSPWVREGGVLYGVLVLGISPWGAKVLAPIFHKTLL